MGRKKHVREMIRGVTCVILRPSTVIMREDHFKGLDGTVIEYKIPYRGMGMITYVSCSAGTKPRNQPCLLTTKK